MGWYKRLVCVVPHTYTTPHAWCDVWPEYTALRQSVRPSVAVLLLLPLGLYAIVRGWTDWDDEEGGANGHTYTHIRAQAEACVMYALMHAHRRWRQQQQQAHTVGTCPQLRTACVYMCVCVCEGRGWGAIRCNSTPYAQDGSFHITWRAIADCHVIAAPFLHEIA